MYIRPYQTSDKEILADLFYTTIHSINIKNYTKEQVDAWATGHLDLEKWNQSFLDHYSLVAIEDDCVVGFGDIDETGYLERLFVHKDYQGQGIATALCDQLEKAASVNEIRVEASITARPFFEKRGYQVTQEQQVKKHGVWLTNYKMKKEIIYPWLDWAKELQFIAQCALAYTKDPYDKERFERIRDISAEMMSYQTNMPFDKVKNLFCNEVGYQTPKLDCRAAIFKENQILLVQERNEKWALPGGWVDANQTIYSNVIKEVQEEAGLIVEPKRIIALHDHRLRHHIIYPYNICKVFVECEATGGEFVKNIETIDCQYFSIDELPPLATQKTTLEQISLCFVAHHSKSWEAQFD